MFLFTIGYIVLKIVNDIIFWQLISTLVVLSATCSTINLLVAPLYVVYRKVGGCYSRQSLRLRVWFGW